MRGLRTKENESFIRYFQLVQQAASERDAVFFASNGEGNVRFFGDMEVEDLCGWLVEKAQADRFEELFLAGQDLDEWVDLITFADYDEANKKIVFEQYGDWGVRYV